MSKVIGMSRNIKLEWLNKVAFLNIIGKSEEEIRKDLNEYLSVEIKSYTNMRKTRKILMNIWTSKDNVEIKDIAASLFNSNKEEELLLAHWCLTLIAYPVFADICGTIGKLDSKMFDITNKDIKNKIFDEWGERSTLYHSIGKNIRTLKDLGVLYAASGNRYNINRYKIDSKEGLIIIAATLVRLKEKLYMSIEELNSSPEMFPFEYCMKVDVLSNNKLFSVDRIGGELVVSCKH